jgi:hypothetical protein
MPQLSNFIVATQRLTWFFYSAVLLVSAVGIVISVYGPARKSVPQRLLRWGVLFASICSVYFAADLAFFFLTPKLKMAVVIFYVVVGAYGCYRNITTAKGSGLFASSMPVFISAYLCCVFLFLFTFPSESSRVITEDLGLTFLSLVAGTQFLTMGLSRSLRPVEPRVGVEYLEVARQTAGV